MADPRGGSSCSALPPPPPPSNLTLVFDWNSYIDRIVYPSIDWLILLMKRPLHFAMKLNPRDIKTCNCFLITSYDLFISARKAVFPPPPPHGDRRSQIEKHVDVSVRSDLPRKGSTVLSEPKFGSPNKKFLDPPLVLIPAQKLSGIVWK